MKHSPISLTKLSEVNYINIKLVTIDGSTQKSGIALFVDGTYRLHTLLDYSKDKNIDSRFKSMSKGLWDFLDTYNPDILYMEETYMAKNPQTTKFLTRLQGVVYAWCIIHDCEFNTILPSQWRKQLGLSQHKGVKRKELKELAVKYILENYVLEVTDDEADAICIADAVIKMYANLGGKGNEN